jgi:DNA-binding NarL/FixJ family response regulator
VKGLLTYKEAEERLADALAAVAKGGFWVPRSLLSRLVDFVLRNASARHMSGGTTNLTRREREVMDAMMENLSNKEIASKLLVSERTVKFHVSNLLAKFGVRRRADLILLYYEALPRA